MASKGKITYESRIDKAKQKIHEKPQQALKAIGSLIVSEVRKVTPRETGYLKKSMGYWNRKKEGDLIVGFKAFYAPMVILGDKFHKANDFFTKRVLEMKDDIQSLIMQALKELEREDND